MSDEPYKWDSEFKGVVLPKALRRNNHSGYVHTKIKQNIIIEDENGNPRTFSLDDNAVKLMEKVNTDSSGKPVSAPMDYVDAINKSKDDVDKEHVKNTSNLSSSIYGDFVTGVHESNKSPETQSVSELMDKMISQRVQVLAEPVAIPKVKPRIPVRLSGPFGALRVLYDDVFVDNICLVLVQRSHDEQFYEAPMNIEGHIDIEINGKTKPCLPGLHFTLPDRKTAFTVYLIDEGTK